MQMLGLCATMRAIYSTELFDCYKELVALIVDDQTLKSMEHRFISPMLKQFIEPLILNCPASLYNSHLAPFLGKLFSHISWRLTNSWKGERALLCRVRVLVRVRVRVRVCVDRVVLSVLVMLV